MKTLRQRVDEFALAHKLKIDEENYLNVVENEGNCPCRVEPHECPCTFALEEINSDGHCMCELFSK